MRLRWIDACNAALLLLLGWQLWDLARQDTRQHRPPETTADPAVSTREKAHPGFPGVSWSLSGYAGAPPEPPPNSLATLNVEIWGKAAIGEYLWVHLLKGTLEERMGGVWFHGKLAPARADVPHLQLTYRSGIGVHPTKVPQDTEHVVLVLNAHEPEKEAAARQWLDHLPQLPRLRNAGLVVLGREDCLNDWLDRYLDSPEYKIRFVFITYGSRQLDERRVWQWPLGVATYRGFPDKRLEDTEAGSRRLLCNFMGTVYANSSRVQLMAILDSTPWLKERCFVNGRMQWQERETKDSALEYQQMLAASEFTLCPVGFNTICYRFYEAASSGSTPIVEDKAQPKTCADPLRLLKSERAPFAFVRDWADLPAFLAAQQALPASEHAQRRRALTAWYAEFKQRMQTRFLRVLTTTFIDA